MDLRTLTEKLTLRGFRCGYGRSGGSPVPASRPDSASGASRVRLGG